MVHTLIESVLPGARSLRPPLISGILWGLFLWIVLSDVITRANQESDWMRQFYAVIGSLGEVVTVGLASILVFILGASFANVSDGVGKAIGGVAFYLQKTVKWQRHAQGSRRELLREEVEKKTELIRLHRALKEARADNAMDTKPAKEAHKALRALERDLREIEQDLAVARRDGFRKLWLRNTPEVRNALGDVPATAHEGLERELVDRARWDGRNAMMEEKSVTFPSHFFHFKRLTGLGLASEPNVEREFISELDVDSLQVLRSASASAGKDIDLYLDMDRQRHEREVRLAFATPLLALAILAALYWDSWLWWAATLVPVGLVVRFSLDKSQERSKVLGLLRLYSLRTPALDRAYEQGKLDVIDAVKERDKARREEKVISEIEEGESA